MSEVEKVLHIHRQRQQVEEIKLKEAWNAREKELWARIETVIRVEEDKVVKKLEEERRMREEEERKRREEEEKRRAEEEKRRREEEERRRAEEEKARKEKEEEERKRREAEEARRRLAEEEELRKMLSFNPADEDWRVARENLRVIYFFEHLFYLLTYSFFVATKVRSYEGRQNGQGPQIGMGKTAKTDRPKNRSTDERCTGHRSNRK